MYVKDALLENINERGLIKKEDGEQVNLWNWYTLICVDQCKISQLEVIDTLLLSLMITQGCVGFIF